jgi:hypothetical protein
VRKPENQGKPGGVEQQRNSKQHNSTIERLRSTTGLSASRKSRKPNSDSRQFRIRTTHDPGGPRVPVFQPRKNLLVGTSPPGAGRPAQQTVQGGATGRVRYAVATGGDASWRLEARRRRSPARSRTRTTGCQAFEARQRPGAKRLHVDPSRTARILAFRNYARKSSGINDSTKRPMFPFPHFNLLLAGFLG